jgi:hypothetical protein
MSFWSPSHFWHGHVVASLSGIVADLKEFPTDANMGKSKGKKRKANEAAIETSIQDVDLPNGWMQKLLALELDLAYVLQVASLANAGQITTSGYEGQDNVAQASLSSFVSLNPRS